jgi:hypothetical protein
VPVQINRSFFGWLAAGALVLGAAAVWAWAEVVAVKTAAAAKRAARVVLADDWIMDIGGCLLRCYKRLAMLTG